MPKYTFDQFFALRRYQGNIAFSPDQTEVAYITDTSGQFNIWRQSVQGGTPVQVTAFANATCRAVEWAANGDLYFLADTDGDEKNQVWRVPAAGGTPENLTNRPDVQYYQISLSRDGKRLYYAGNAVTPTENHIFMRDLTTGESDKLCGGPGFWVAADESHDGRHLLVLESLSNTIANLHVLDLQTESLDSLIGMEAAAERSPGPWAADDSGFYFTADEGRDFMGLYFYDRVTGQVMAVAEPDWDVSDLLGDREGRRLLYTVNEDGYSRAYLQDLTTGNFVALPAALSQGVIATYTLSPDGNKLAYRITAPNLPSDCYVLDLGTSETTRLTHSLLSDINEADLVVSELVHFPTFDGRQIPAWLYKPANLPEGARIPVALSVHGGPEAQERPNYVASYQYMLDQGVAVLAPNIRGSTGYGKSYQKLIHRDWGGGDLKDLAACAQYLRSLPWVDPERIAVWGGSYGGFATLQAVTRLPEYWACGVDFCGPSNLITFTKSVPPTWRSMLRDWVGDPDEDEALLVERSPITYVDQVRCPLMVVQGANDPRVVKAESDQMVDRLRGRGLDVEYLVFDDEGHGFSKRHNMLAGTKAMTDYLIKHLKG